MPSTATLAPDVIATIDGSRTPLVATQDLGLVGTPEDASAPHVVSVAAGVEYVVKGSEWVHGQPYLCANEWIAGLLAIQCGLPTLPMVVVQYESSLVVGWPRVSASKWSNLHRYPDLLDDSANAEFVYQMVVFDALIRTMDRHDKNVIGVRVSERVPRYRLIMYDQSHAVVHPALAPSALPASQADWGPSGPDVPETWDAPDLWIRSLAVRQRITDYALLADAVQHIRARCSADVIKAVVRTTPSPWLSTTDAQPITAFLADRSDRLGEVVDQKVRKILPHLLTG